VAIFKLKFVLFVAPVLALVAAFGACGCGARW
jgi:hypothetical protein